jgi:hypothetical protein
MEIVMPKWLSFSWDFVSAVLGLIAAYLWLQSAFGPIPPIKTYWGQTPESDPYRQAVVKAAILNCWAAGLTGVSTGLIALKMIVSLFVKAP